MPSRFWAAAGRLTVEETELPAGYQPVAPLASLDVGPGTSTELTFVDVISADLSLSVANPSTVRRNGSVGIVYTVRNAGPASVAPRVADYRCAQVRYITGDFNRDQMLDPNEIWTYRCVYARHPRQRERRQLCPRLGVEPADGMDPRRRCRSGRQRRILERAGHPLTVVTTTAQSLEPIGFVALTR